LTTDGDPSIQRADFRFNPKSAIFDQEIFNQEIFNQETLASAGTP
jgi:hypothetical protein